MKQGVKQKQMNWSSIRNPCMSWYRRLQSSLRSLRTDHIIWSYWGIFWFFAS
jgi:hypothetical protein